jgi:hypothetical protein
MVPSTGTRSPGRTTTVCPTRTSTAATCRTSSPSTSQAVRGTRAASARIPARARPAAMPSISSPAVNRNTTTPASAVAPISTAPTVAIDISISMLNGEPALARATALPPANHRPSRAAGSSVHPATSGTSWPVRYPRMSRVPMARSGRAFRIRRGGFGLALRPHMGHLVPRAPCDRGGAHLAPRHLPDKVICVARRLTRDKHLGALPLPGQRDVARRCPNAQCGRDRSGPGSSPAPCRSSRHSRAGTPRIH